MTNVRIVYDKSILTNGELPVGTRRTFSCYPGYNLEGHEVSFCVSTGDWTNAPPQCNQSKY